QVDQVFVQKRTGLDDGFLRIRIDDVLGRCAAQNTVAQRFDDFTAFEQRLHRETAGRAAIDFGDDQVLRHVHQTTRQVTRVGRLQCRIGQTLTSPVGRDEVLEYVQAFTEVCGNGRLDDRAVRLGHQAAHTGKLTNLGSRT